MLGRLWELCAGTGCTAALSREYRRFWDGLPARSPCIHLGADTGRREACTTCRGKVELKVFHCRHPNHETTVLPYCHSCPDFEAQPCPCP
jgi:hypothetical protein